MPSRTSKLQRLLAQAAAAEAAEFLYFAYGSNLDLKQIRARCPSARLVGPARLRGYALAFGGYSQRWSGSVATVLPAKGSAVQGMLFRMRVGCFGRLDAFEGHPYAYKRTPVLVRDDKGRSHKALTYIQPLDTFESWPPSAQYFSQIFEAYMHHEFDPRPLIHAASPRLFVYGSLMKGYSNHRVLDGARFIGRSKTMQGFRMHSLEFYPGVCHDADSGSQVHGEIYEVDADVLTRVDRLEGHPRFYRRTLIQLEDGTTAETYLLRDDQVENLPVVATGDWRKHKDSK